MHLWTLDTDIQSLEKGSKLNRDKLLSEAIKLCQYPVSSMVCASFGDFNAAYEQLDRNKLTFYPVNRSWTQATEVLTE